MKWKKILPKICLLTAVISTSAITTAILAYNSNSKNLLEYKDNTILLNVRANPIEVTNGCVPAATQNIIEYTTNQNVSQYDLAKLEKTNQNQHHQGTNFWNAVPVLNNSIFPKRNNKNKYVYQSLSHNFGTTICQQETFYKAIYHSLANNFPVLLWICGYFFPHYKNWITHAVVINGVKKENKIEDYKYYISDNNYSNRYLEIKNSDLSSLFATTGGIIFYYFENWKQLLQKCQLI